MILTGWRYFRAPDERDPLRTWDRPADGIFYLSALASLAANSRFGLLLMDLPAVVRQGTDGKAYSFTEGTYSNSKNILLLYIYQALFEVSIHK